MKIILVTFALLIAFTYTAAAQNELGINAEHMPYLTHTPGDTSRNVDVIKTCIELPPITLLENQPATADMYNDTITPAAFIIIATATKPAFWYITRMTVVLK